MATTVIRGAQILNNTVQRQDLDVSTVGQAVVTKIVQGGGITLSSTGADSGTGDVTVSSPDVVSTDAGNIATLGTDNHILVPQSQIWSVRLRSFNAVGNPTFEVDQRNVGNSIALSGTAFPIDRWNGYMTGTTMAASAQQTAGNVVLPGTNFIISQSFLRITLTSAQAALGAADQMTIYQQVEGIALRELIGDVTSLSILVRSSVANLKFGVSVTTPTSGYSLNKLATLTTANTWTLLTFPNIPVWAAGASWSVKPGTVGYKFQICPAAGSINIPTANDIWNSTAGGNPAGAVGQSNFAASAVNSTLDIAYISHEPGAQSSNPPMDCPFTQNYDDCLRYFCKSYNYAIKPGTVSNPGRIWGPAFVNSHVYISTAFKKQMAKAPTITGYSPPTGAINSVRDEAGLDRSINGVLDSGEIGFGGFTLSTPNGSQTIYDYHYTADTGL